MHFLTGKPQGPKRKITYVTLKVTQKRREERDRQKKKKYKNRQKDNGNALFIR